MLRSMTRLWTGCVAEVLYYSEIPPFFPFTRGYLILAFDGMACRAEDGRELIDCPVVSFQSTGKPMGPNRVPVVVWMDVSLPPCLSLPAMCLTMRSQRHRTPCPARAGGFS